MKSTDFYAILKESSDMSLAYENTIEPLSLPFGPIPLSARHAIFR
jgi:hypothetical protein